MKLNLNHIELKFFDFDISIENLSSLLNLKPTKSWLKGDLVSYNKNSGILRKQNYWGFEYKTETNEFIGNDIEKFINEIIKPRIKLIKELTKLSHGEFGVTQYYSIGINPGYYFTKKDLEIIYKSGLELNVDCYIMN